MADVPEAKAELIKSNPYETAGLIVTLAAIGTFIWAINSNTPDDTQIAAGYTFFALGISTIPLSIQTSKHRKKAVRIFNSHVLSQ